MKKILSVVLVVALAATMVLSLGACGKKEEPAPAPVETPVVNPADKVDTTDKVDVNLADIVDTMKATYGEDYLANQMVTDATVLEQLVGLTPDMYEEFYLGMPMMSAHCDTLLVVRAIEEKATDVITAVEAYQKKLQEDTMQYPQNVAKIAESAIDVREDYVIFRILGGYYEPAEVTEVEEVAEGEISAEEKAELDFYAAETKKGTDALELLYDIGFNAWDEEERAELGLDAIMAAMAEANAETETAEPIDPATETETEPTEEPVEATADVVEETPAGTEDVGVKTDATVEGAEIGTEIGSAVAEEEVEVEDAE